MVAEYETFVGMNGTLDEVKAMLVVSVFSYMNMKARSGADED